MSRPVKGERTPGSGRQKGKPNAKTDALIEICERKGISPFEGLLELTQSDDLNIRLGALKEVCQYLYPKRKALELSTDEDSGFVVVIKDYTGAK